ncbi:hypothetical protein G3M48_008448 [Beauveria asiatica]|uniref:RBP protein n=1 Tax=Beauveria asiatica TaxID=1069075 RepID=A0AAW0RKD8_9HYPO
MDFANLPAHTLAMDEPSPSEVVKNSEGDMNYRWIMTDTERAHIANMLDVDASIFSIRGNIMNQERSVCGGCGKHSGLDDLVHNAFYAGIHSAPFMVDVLVNGPKGPSPPHDLVCSRCITKHEGLFGWPGGFNWTY